MRKNLAKFHSDLQWQVQQAQRFPVLLPDEERRLAEHWRTTQDPAAAERLLGSHLRLVIKIARSFSAREHSRDPIGALHPCMSCLENSRACSKAVENLAEEPFAAVNAAALG